MNNNNRIGIFDSGLGGLTVLRQMQKNMPHERFIYFGDTAHVPYGNKSKETIIKYCLKIIEFFKQKKVKLIIVACNTASSVALRSIKKATTIPIIDVITPAVDEIKHLKKTKKIGVIGTEKTIQSKKYEEKIKTINKQYQVYSKPCPLFVPIIEEGLFDSKVAQVAVDMYLTDIVDKIDTLILGCTHYPIMINAIQKKTNNQIYIIDSALATAKYVKKKINQHNICSNSNNKNNNLYYVSDKLVRFNEISNMFLNKKVSKIHKAKL